MHCFPLELCQHIYKFACTDDGKTGQSLALVSKYIHDTSEPYKLQSIAIRGAEQAVSFVSLLEKTPPHLRRVVFLLIYNDLTDALPIFYHVADDKASSSVLRTTMAVTNLIPGVKRYRELKTLKERGKRATTYMETNRRRDEKIFPAFLKILTIVSTSLSTLDVDFESRWRIVPPRSPFTFAILPGLTSLTINYYALYHAELTGSPLPSLPVLVYLDLAGFRIRSLSFNVYERITKLAPSLTHLRLPARMASNLVQGLGLSIIKDQDQRQPNDSSDHTNRLPSTLQRVFIQLSVQPEFTCCRQWGHWEIHTRYRLLAERDERVVVLNVDDEGVHIEELVRRSQFVTDEMTANDEDIERWSDSDG